MQFDAPAGPAAEEEFMLRITALAENKENHEKMLAGEHGLSIYIEYGNRKVLLDTGTTGLFAENARKLGISLADVDIAVLSHAHYDHSGGCEAFFAQNLKARLYLQSGCCENCFRIPGRLLKTGSVRLEDLGQEELKYIGLCDGFMAKYKERLQLVDGDMSIAPGIWLVAHHSPGLLKKGRTAGMCRLWGDHLEYDDFSHEQSLVFETSQGLVIFNSCCHSGPDVVIDEVRAHPILGGRPVFALFGGFHLKDISGNDQGRAQIQALGQRLLDTGVPHFYTGHCTGEAAFEQLSKILGERLHYFKTGDTATDNM